jgi:DNA-binding Xre family transcriptional regulator
MSRAFIFDSLRAHLKARGLTYRKVAQELGLSEQTLKRIFANNDCTIERLEQICRVLQIELSDLVKSSPRKSKLIEQLSREQEHEIAGNKKLLMVAICVMSLWTVEDMLNHLTLSRTECFSLMRKLEAIGFLELRQDNQYKLLVARHFTWIVDGPIMRMVKGVAEDFFNHRFEAPGEILKIINVRVSPQAQERLKIRLEQIAQEYADQVVVDSHLPLDERPVLSVCIAARRWVPNFLRDLLKQDDSALSSASRKRTLATEAKFNQ